MKRKVIKWLKRSGNSLRKGMRMGVLNRRSAIARSRGEQKEVWRGRKGGDMGSSTNVVR